MQIGGCIVKIKNDEGRDVDETSEIRTMPSHLGAIILSNSKGTMNLLIVLPDGFKTKSGYYMDTDSLYYVKKHWDKPE